MKKIFLLVLLLQNCLLYGQNIQTLGNKNNTVRANGRLDADSGTYSKGVKVLTQADTVTNLVTPASLIPAARNAISVTGTGGSYNSGTGVININGGGIIDTTSLNARITVNKNNITINTASIASLTNDRLSFDNFIFCNTSSGANPITIINISGNNVTFTIGGGYITSSITSPSYSYITLPSLTATTLTNTGKLYIDFSNFPASLSWTTSDPGAEKGRCVATNFYGNIISDIGSFNTWFQDAIDKYKNQKSYSVTNLIGLTVSPFTSVTNVTINNITGTTTSFTIGAINLWNGITPVSRVNPAVGTFTLGNTGILYMDLTVPTAPTFSTSPPAIGSGVILVANLYGRLCSQFAPLQSAIDSAYKVYYASLNVRQDIHYLIKPDSAGYIPSGAFDTTYTTAAARISDASYLKQYWLNFAPGIYWDTSHGIKGISLKDYIHIDGGNANLVTFASNGTSVTSDQFSYDVITGTNSTTIVKNITLLAKNCKYNVHISGFVHPKFDHCDFIHQGSTFGYGYNIGIDFYPIIGNNDIYITDCNLYGEGIYGHNTYSTSGQRHNYNDYSKLVLDHVNMKEFYFQDYLQYTQDSLLFRNCNIRYVKYAVLPQSYLSTTTDSPKFYNLLGLPHMMNIVDNGSNVIGRHIYPAELRDTSFAISGHPRLWGGLNDMYYNNSSLNIPQGLAVVRVADSVGFSFNTNAISYKNINQWSGNGEYIGVTQEQCGPYNKCVIQVSGLPLVSFNNSAGNASYGSPLTINSSGQFIIASGADKIYGYSRGIATVNGTMLEIKLAQR